MTGVLVALSGPPGAGKSTLAAALAGDGGAVVLSADAAEDGMLAAGVPAEAGTGLAAYLVVERIAEENLRAGALVVVDAVNDHPLARQQWRDLAERVAARLLEVELAVPPDLQRRRLAARRRPFSHLPEPDADASAARIAAFEGRGGEVLRLDAAAPVASLRAAVRAAAAVAR